MKESKGEKGGPSGVWQNHGKTKRAVWPARKQSLTSCADGLDLMKIPFPETRGRDFGTNAAGSLSCNYFLRTTLLAVLARATRRNFGGSEPGDVMFEKRDRISSLWLSVEASTIIQN